MTRETRITMKHCYITHAPLPVPVPTCSLYAHFLYTICLPLSSTRWSTFHHLSHHLEAKDQSILHHLCATTYLVIYHFQIMFFKKIHHMMYKSTHTSTRTHSRMYAHTHACTPTHNHYLILKLCILIPVFAHTLPFGWSRVVESKKSVAVMYNNFSLYR